MTSEELQQSDSGDLERRPLFAVYWQGDYVGHYDYRVAYPWYVAVSESADAPHLQEDRFRNREDDQFEYKDYTPEMTVRGLWHSTMAGGVANVWGNLLSHGDSDRGSEPYDNGATGEIQGIQFEMDVRDEIRTCHEFWFGRDRFTNDFVRANELTDDEPGDRFLRPAEPTPISVCLRDRSFDRFVFYAEGTETMTADLRDADGPLQAVAVDTRRGYRERDLGRLKPATHALELDRESDWTVAVGRFE